MAKIVIEKVLFGGNCLECLWDQDKYAVRWQGQEYESLASLMKSCVGLQQDLVSLAKVANHLFQGLNFVVIDDPQRFKASYEERIAWEEQHPEQAPWVQLSDFGTFDVSLMDFPRMEKDTLEFYVFCRQSGVPYVVKCFDLGLQNKEPTYHYLLFPRKEGKVLS